MTPKDDLNFLLEGHDVDAYLAHDEEETKRILSQQVKLCFFVTLACALGI